MMKNRLKQNISPILLYSRSTKSTSRPPKKPTHFALRNCSGSQTTSSIQITCSQKQNPAPNTVKIHLSISPKKGSGKLFWPHGSKRPNPANTQSSIHEFSTFTPLKVLVPSGRLKPIPVNLTKALPWLVKQS